MGNVNMDPLKHTLLTKEAKIERKDNEKKHVHGKIRREVDICNLKKGGVKPHVIRWG